MAFDKSFLNIIQIGFVFMFIFTAFQTMGNIQQTIIDSIKQEDKTFEGDGYTSLAIIYAVLSTLNWAAPSIICVIGPKISMIIGGITYLFFIISFLFPKTWLLYLASVIIGCGAALLWTGQGNYLTLNSSKATISRNSGIFWAMLQLSLFIGNIFVYFKFQGLTTIDKDTRTVVIWVLSGIAILGLVILVLLPKAKNSDGEVVVEASRGPIEALKAAGNLFVTKRMLLLTVTFFYSGLELSFFSGVYSNSIGFTNQLGSQAKELVGMSGIFIGLGEVLGGGMFGIFGNKTNKWGRDPIVMAGFVLHAIAFFLIFLNLPDPSPLGKTDATAFITTNAILAIFCSFLLGFGDACFNTQMYSILGGVYSNDSSSAFAIFKFVQSVAAAVCFFYASHVGLYIQLGILLVAGILGTITFVMVEWALKKEARLEADVDTVSEVSSKQ